MENDVNNSFKSPFCSRYGSKEMLYIFSPNMKFKTWRKLWLALAKAESELGLPISSSQIEEMKANIDIIDYETAKKMEKSVKHDVMAHLFSYGKQCPNAAKIIHLGATSCYITDNASIIIMRQGLILIEKKLTEILKILSRFAMKYKNLPCLSYTHLQPAQLTTVGKRATLWLQDFYMDYLNISGLIKNLKLLGSKGATGTQASFLELFENNEEKVDLLEQKILKEFEFKEAVYVSGQTYTRKLDFNICSTLCGIAQSAMKLSNDIRMLQNFKELEEPFEESQIGSSAMPYKRNPMKSERVAALSRYVIVNLLNPAFTAACQYFERTLDDSANRRIVIPETFLAVDAILNILLNICSGVVVNESVIKNRVLNELPFMATENIMMAAVKKGGDRQKIHEKLRVICMQVAKDIASGGKNNLIQRLVEDGDFNLNEEEIHNILKPENFIGLSPKQVDRFLEKVIEPITKNINFNFSSNSELSV